MNTKQELDTFSDADLLLELYRRRTSLVVGYTAGDIAEMITEIRQDAGLPELDDESAVAAAYIADGKLERKLDAIDELGTGWIRENVGSWLRQNGYLNALAA